MFNFGTFNESQASLRQLNKHFNIANKFFQLRETLSRWQYYIENVDCNIFEVSVLSAYQILDFVFVIRGYKEKEKYFVGLVLHLFYSYQKIIFRENILPYVSNIHFFNDFF